jgi:two-component system, chemotaxis family, protein-glutamate methylesterase/glutaminase
MTDGIVVIGSSLGGLKALETILSGLNADFPLPIAIVQHRSKSDEDLLCLLLQRYTPLTVKEAEDKEIPSPQTIYIAPSDYHLLVDRTAFTLSLEAPVNYARPSVDTLFESAAEAYGTGVVAVVLTGGNRDGARGAAAVKDAGGLLIVQDPADCESSIMPLAAIQMAAADKILKLAEIASCLIDTCIVKEESVHEN